MSVRADVSASMSSAQLGVQRAIATLRGDREPVTYEGQRELRRKLGELEDDLSQLRTELTIRGSSS